MDPDTIIKKITKCGYCNQTYKMPIFLPCYATICEEDLFDLCLPNREIKCPFCERIHKIPDRGFSTNDNMNDLLAINIAKLEQTRLSNSNLNTEQEENDEFSEVETFKNIVKKPNEFILNHFLCLKKELSSRKDIAIKTINEVYQTKLEEIEKNELKCLNRLNECESNNQIELIEKRKTLNDHFQHFDELRKLRNENKCDKHNQILKIVVEIDLFKSFLLHDENYSFRGNKFEFDDDYFGNSPGLDPNNNNNKSDNKSGNGKIIRQTKMVRFDPSFYENKFKDSTNEDKIDQSVDATNQKTENLDESHRLTDVKFKIDLIKGIETFGKDVSNIGHSMKQIIDKLLNGQNIIVYSRNCLDKYFLASVFLLQKLDATIEGCQSIILTPIDDQAIQIQESIQNIGKFLNFKSSLFIGRGRYSQEDLENICGTNQIWISSFERLSEFSNLGFLDFKNVKTVITFGCQKFFNYQNIKKFDSILSNIENKSSLQQLFFATSNQFIDKIASRMNEPHDYILKLHDYFLKGIQFFYYEVERDYKLKAIYRIKRELSNTKIIVFCNDDAELDYINTNCDTRQLRYLTINSKVSLSRRESLLAKFKSSTTHDALFVTDNLAYTSELKEYKLIVNYDLPYEFEFFINRILRGAYMSEVKPYVVSLVSNVQQYLLTDIEKSFNIRFERSNF